MKVFSKSKALAMYFPDDRDLKRSWMFANQFSAGGHLATLPEIAAGRALASPDAVVWTRFFTTTSAEYVGYTKQGNKVIVIGHGVGPMVSVEDILSVYEWESADPHKERRGGRITRSEFLAVANGDYGPVSVLDFWKYRKQYNRLTEGPISFNQAIEDPLVRARLGDSEGYLRAHRRLAVKWHEQAIIELHDELLREPNRSRWETLKLLNTSHEEAVRTNNPLILDLSLNAFPYDTYLIEEGFALAHLLDITQVHPIMVGHGQSYISRIMCHQWDSFAGFVGVKPDSRLSTARIHPGPEIPHTLLYSKWRECMVPAVDRRIPSLCGLVRVRDGSLFTQIPRGARESDTEQPEFLVKYHRAIGQPVEFRYDISESSDLSYSLADLEEIAPRAANAYLLVGNPELIKPAGEEGYQRVLVQFYAVEVDTSRRLLRIEELIENYDLVMALLD